MIYSSVSFIFFALSVLLVFVFIPTKLRALWLFVASLLWLISWNWSWAILFSGISVFNLLSLHFLKTKIQEQKNKFFPMLIGLNVLFFIIAKTAVLFNENFKTPYGISFFMFMHIGYIFDVWRSAKDFDVENEQDFLLFPVFFPVLVGGPILRGKDFFPQMRKSLTFQKENLIDGTLIFAVGFCKYYFLSKSFVAINNALLTATTRTNFFFIFLFGLSGTFQAYIDFSSFCDMGRGLALCFGFRFPVNFTAFYFARNPSDFWQRWNITLGTWIRDYITFPLMFRFGRKISPNWILFFSFLLVGLWHGLTLNWILFGAFNGLVVVGYNYANKKMKGRAPGRIFALAIFVGNGIFQRPNFGLIFSHSFAKPGLFFMPIGLPNYLLKELTVSVITAFVALLFYDLTVEKKGADWPVQLPKKMKTLMFIFIIIMFVLSLKSNHFLEDVTLPPAYFRI